MSRWARWDDEPGLQRLMSRALTTAHTKLAPICDPEFQIYLMTVRADVERRNNGWEADGRTALRMFEESGFRELLDRG